MAKTIKDHSDTNSKRILPNSLQETDELIQNHNAHVQAIENILKFTRNESEAIKTKILAIEPETVRQADATKLTQFLNVFQNRFETMDVEWRCVLEQHRRLCQFDADLLDITTTLSQLNDQLLAIRGQYGESVASARATSKAFSAFEATICLLEGRIKTFITSGEELLEATANSRIEMDIQRVRERWITVCEQVSLNFFCFLENR